MGASHDFALQRAQILVGSYRTTKAENPSNFVSALAKILNLFDRRVAEEATDPVNGIQSTDRFLLFPPNCGELRQFCDALVRRNARLNHNELPATFQPRPYSRYYTHPDQFSPSDEDRRRVAAALALYKSAIKPMEEPARPAWHSPTDTELLAHYGRRPGLQPIPFE
jgi:hypothetical protein